jgi:hypothetical protein
MDAGVNAIINSNRKQAHQSRTPHYEKQIEFFVKLYLIINKTICLFLELLFLSTKALWVAIDCRSKNWVAVLKSLGSTDIRYTSILSIHAE